MPKQFFLKSTFCNNFGRDGNLDREKAELSESSGAISDRSSSRNSPQTRVYPFAFGAGSARPNPRNGAPQTENPHRVYRAQRGIGTMVSDHGLGRGQTMG